MDWLPLRGGEGERRGLIWLTIALTTAVTAWYLVPFGDVDVVDAALAMGLTVIVPYGLHLVVPVPRWRDDLVQRQTPAEMALLGALAVIVTSAWETGDAIAAGLLWLLPVLGVGAATLRQFGWLPGRRRAWTVGDWTALVALAWLAVGASWLVIHEAGWRPLGLDGQIVELTAVHFHFAGFAGTVIAREVWTATRTASPRAALVALVGTAASPPVIAIGFAAVPVLQVVGAVTLTIGLWTAAWLTVRHVVPGTGRAESALLTVSAASVLVPMLLASQWALGNVAGTPALSIPDMAAFHGTTNALGFSLLGLVAWRRIGAEVEATTRS